MATLRQANSADPGALGKYPVFAITFGAVFSVFYLFVMNYSWQLFSYYPKAGQLTFWTSTLPATAGPQMKWYGYVATCAIVSFIAGLIVCLLPTTLLRRIWWPGLIWLVPGLAMLAALYLILYVGD